MSETEFARAERLSRELYFSNEKLKVYDRMAASGVWVEAEKYSDLIKEIANRDEMIRVMMESLEEIKTGHARDDDENAGLGAAAYSNYHRLKASQFRAENTLSKIQAIDNGEGE